MSRDVKLTDEERRIIAEIEKHERSLRSRWPWRRFPKQEASRRDLWAWTAVGVGVAVLVAGLAMTVPLMPFVGFVILLSGTTRLSRRISAWPSRLHVTLRRSRSRLGSSREAP